MRLICPACQAGLKVPAHTALDRKIRCPGCGEIFSLAAGRGGVSVDEKSVLQSTQWQRFDTPQYDSVPSGAGEAKSLAWEQDGSLPLGFLRTCWQVLLYSWLVFRPTAWAGYKKPFWFSAILLFLGLAPWAADELINPQYGLNPTFITGGLLLGPLVIALALFGLAGLQHGLLFLFGVKRGGYRATYRVLAYSQAFHLLGLLSWLGLFSAAWAIGLDVTDARQFLAILPWFWWVVVLVLGFSAAHRADFARVFVLLFLEVALVIMALLAVFVG